MIPKTCSNCIYYLPARVAEMRGRMVNEGEHFCSTAIKRGIHSTCPRDREYGLSNAVRRVKMRVVEEDYYLKEV